MFCQVILPYSNWQWATIRAKTSAEFQQFLRMGAGGRGFVLPASPPATLLRSRRFLDPPEIFGYACGGLVDRFSSTARQKMPYGFGGCRRQTLRRQARCLSHQKLKRNLSRLVLVPLHVGTDVARCRCRLTMRRVALLARPAVRLRHVKLFMKRTTSLRNCRQGPYPYRGLRLWP